MFQLAAVHGPGAAFQRIAFQAAGSSRDGGAGLRTRLFDRVKTQSPIVVDQNVISLAALDNVAIKISGACTLAHEPFPYPDIWEPLGKIFEAFGFDRCLWGTDWTRAVELLNYEQGVEAFRVTDQLSDSERSTLMGGSLAKIYKWSPSVGG